VEIRRASGVIDVLKNLKVGHPNLVLEEKGLVAQFGIRPGTVVGI
jgi:hypothetical protein